MNYFKINHVERPISELIMGTDYFRPEIIEQVTEMMENYITLGGNILDTAYIYAGGKSEEAIGMWIEANNRRDDIMILTKGGHPNQDGSRINRSAINEELNVSLDRLKTDYVEFYALHRDDPRVSVGEILEILNEQVESGRIGAFGGSNWTYERLQEANDYANKNGLMGFSFSSPNFSLAKAQEPYWADCVSVDDETLAWHEGSKLPLLSWSAQARGFFTGRFTKKDRSNQDLVRVFYNDENWERYRRAEQLAKEKNVETIQISLAYVLNQSYPSAAIIGPQNFKELLSCHNAAQISLTEDEIKWLDLRIT